MLTPDAKPRILFVGEAVTLAHVARPLTLAKTLDATSCQIAMACDRRHAGFVEASGIDFHDLASIPSERFLHALANGSPVYDDATLAAYVRDDLALIDRFRPDLIVGDFRLSLSVSARLTGVRYATVTNAYWSPQFSGRGFPLPVLSWTNRVPLRLAQALFNLFRPVAMRSHCGPLNRLRARHGLPSLGDDLRRVYTDADEILYADAPDQFPLAALGAPTEGHRFIGPLLWSPPVALPPWWSDLPSDQPLVYVTLGSSGAVENLWRVLAAVDGLDATFMVSTAGAPEPSGLPANVKTARYLPGSEAAARSRLVICNGGSLTSQQALVSNVPVLGIASNMDQMLNMASIESAGGGTMVRADRLRPRELRDLVSRMIEPGSHCRHGAERLGAQLRACRSKDLFADWVREAFARKHSHQ